MCARACACIKRMGGVLLLQPHLWTSPGLRATASSAATSSSTSACKQCAGAPCSAHNSAAGAARNMRTSGRTTERTTDLEQRQTALRLVVGEVHQQL